MSGDGLLPAFAAAVAEARALIADPARAAAAGAAARRRAWAVAAGARGRTVIQITLIRDARRMEIAE